MPGTWTPSTPLDPGAIPGVYIDFVSSAQAAINIGVIGTVAIAGISDWGPQELVTVLNGEQDIINNFANSDSASATLYRQCRQAFLGGATKVLAFRMVGTSPVKGTLNLLDLNSLAVIRIDAKYVGVYGNNFSLTIAANVTDNTKTDIKLFNSGVLVRTWTTTVNSGASGFVDNVVSLINSDNNNLWIVAVKLANGANNLAAISAVSLASGANGNAISGTNYTNAQNAFEIQDFNIFTAETVNSGIRASIQSWVDTMRSNEGKKIMAVLGSDVGDSISTGISTAQGMNNEGMVFVFPGAVLPNAAGVLTTYSGAQVSSRIAGMIAARNIGESMTNRQIDAATNVETRTLVSDQKLLLAAGVCLLSWTGTMVTVLRGLTTLYNPPSGKPAAFKKINVVRTADAIANAIKVSAENSFIGKVPNDKIGQDALIAAVNKFLGVLVKSRAVEPGFTCVLDPDYDSTGDQVFLKIGITIIDAMEYIFITITI
jgi:hypothetical protein